MNIQKTAGKALVAAAKKGWSGTNQAMSILQKYGKQINPQYLYEAMCNLPGIRSFEDHLKNQSACLSLSDQTGNNILFNRYWLARHRNRLVKYLYENRREDVESHIISTLPGKYIK